MQRQLHMQCSGNGNSRRLNSVRPSIRRWRSNM